MKVNELLSKIQKLKYEGKIDGETQITTYDAWKEEKKYDVEDIDVVDGKIILF